LHNAHSTTTVRIAIALTLLAIDTFVIWHRALITVEPESGSSHCRHVWYAPASFHNSGLSLHRHSPMAAATAGQAGKNVWNHQARHG